MERLKGEVSLEGGVGWGACGLRQSCVLSFRFAGAVNMDDLPHRSVCLVVFENGSLGYYAIGISRQTGTILVDCKNGWVFDEYVCLPKPM
jgi:hypothetical protein